MDLEKYRLLFVDDATEHLVEMSRALCVLGEGGRPEERAEAIDTLFRMTHSIKGMAASLDYDAASSLAHGLGKKVRVVLAGDQLICNTQPH